MNTNDILTSLKIRDLDAGTVFSGKPSGTKVKGYAKPTALTPKVNPDYT